MHHCSPFRWPCGVIEAIHAALPDAACPGLPRKPLGATIRQLLAPYCPGGHQDNSNQNIDENVPTLLAVSVAMAVQRYNTAFIVQWRRFMASLKVTKHCHWASTHSDNINRTCLPPLFVVYCIVKLSKKATKHKDSP